MEDWRTYDHCLFVDENGNLLFTYTVYDLMFVENGHAEITGIIEFNDRPQFCDHEHIYYSEDE